jgi:2,4-dienoyl-CoA reductase-like NADH-dependent reductase (Old Yellow Enzyme family)
MSILFEPYKIGSMEIRNRFMRSATTSAYSDPDGVVRHLIIKLYEDLAKGSVGLIVKGHLYIAKKGKAHVGMAGINSDKQIPKLKELTDAVHRHSSKIIAQLNYGGYQAGSGERAGPSNYKGEGWTARQMTVAEIWGAVDAFGEAASRSLEAGFDGIQIHGAHGYLISEFLSKHANTRTDEWGGSLKNRMTLLKEVYDEVRGRLGPEVPVTLKMNCDDFSTDGFTVEEAAQVAQAMAARGIDLIEVSGGGIGQRNELHARAKHADLALSEVSFAGHCEKIRAATRPKTLALVNGFRTLAAMQVVVDRGIADVISMSRPFIREPDLVRRLEAGQLEAGCIRCDACEAAEVFSKEMLRCRTLPNPHDV